MTNRLPKEYIAQIAKASTYFAFKNGPIKELIVNTMNKFYVNDTEEVVINDDGFDKFYDSLFPKTNNITVK